MNVTVKVKPSGNLKTILPRLVQGIETGMAIGGEIMAQAVEASANDMARYPTGELESTIGYDPISSGIITRGRVVAGSDHVMPFEFGATQHFVPYEEADERIKAGLYTHIKPVYKEDLISSGLKPSNSYNSPIAGSQPDRIPIGYLVSSSEHPFMEQGFNATAKTVAQEIANQIALALQ